MFQLDSTLRGTDSPTELSMIFWIDSLTRVTVTRSFGQVNHIPSWRRKTILTGGLEHLKALCSANNVILNTSVSNI